MDGRFPKDVARQHAQRQQVAQQGCRQQGLDFAGIGLRDIADHADIDQYAILVHEVGCTRTDDEEQYECRFQCATERE
ncbi:hypothetical protein D3C76_1461610 [compost metagenome]